MADGYHPDRRPSPRLIVARPRLRHARDERETLGDFETADLRLRTRASEAEATRADAETVITVTLARVDLRAGVVACRATAAGGRRAEPRRQRSAPGAGVYVLKALTGVDVTADFPAAVHDTVARLRLHKTARMFVSNLAELEATRGVERGQLRDTDQLLLRDELDDIEAARLADGNALLFNVTPRSAAPRVTDLDDLLRGMLRLYALDSVPIDHLVDGIQVAFPLRRWLPFSREAAPPGSPQPPQRVARALLVALLTGRPDPATEDKKPTGLGADASAPRPVAPQGRGEDEDSIGSAVQGRRFERRVGVRRLASLAQEEGELLALRLPEAGAKLLALATRLSRGSNDHVATVKAATTARIAAYKAEQRDVMTGLTQPLQEGWNHLDVARTLPWGALDATATEIADEKRPVGQASRCRAPARGVGGSRGSSCLLSPRECSTTRPYGTEAHPGS